MGIRRACAVPTHGMVDDPQFSRSYLAADAAVKQLQRSLQEQYSLEVQARRARKVPPFVHVAVDAGQ